MTGTDILAGTFRDFRVRRESIGLVICSAVLIVVLFFPPLISGYRFRIDYAVLLLLPVLVMTRLALQVSRREMALFVALSAFSFGIVAAVLLQFLTEKAYSVNHIVPALAAIKWLFIFLLFSSLIRGRESIIFLTKMIAFGVIFHGVIGWLEYTKNYTYISSIMNTYGVTERVVGHRAIGLFDKVHSLGFFLIYGITFLTMMRSLDSRVVPKIIYFSALFFGCLGLAVSFSRSIYIMLSLVFLYAFFISKFREKQIMLIVSAVFIAAILLSGIQVERITARLSEVISAVINLKSDYVFVSGRLDHGISNAVMLFKESPLYGSVPGAGKIFVGDNGIFSWLANYGLIGVLGWIIWVILTLWVFCAHAEKRVYSIRVAGGAAILFLVIMIGATATQPFTERSADLIPIFLVLYMKWSLMSVKKTSQSMQRKNEDN